MFAVFKKNNAKWLITKKLEKPEVAIKNWHCRDTRNFRFADSDYPFSYCNDWCLTVNPTKTKILVFNKAGRHLRHKFKYKACELECVQHCKYLGVYFSASGTFSYAQDELYKKSLKAYFKLQKDFLSLSPKPKTSIHIFDHTIKPIVLYGCEIWGTFNSNTARFRNGTVSPDRIYSNLIGEKLHTKFCKFYFRCS